MPNNEQYERTQSFLTYLKSTPAEALLSDFTFSLLNLAVLTPQEKEDRFYYLSNRVKEVVSPTKFDTWHAECTSRWNKDPEAFLDGVVEQRDKEQRRGAYKAKRLSSVKSKSVEWLAPGVFPRGRISIIGADGGTGKGLYTAQFVAMVTTGKPNDFFLQPCKEPGDVLIFPGEDDPESVLRPRLLAAGADLERVSFVTPEEYYNETGSTLNLASEDMQHIIEQVSPALVIIDPLQQFLPGNVSMIARNEMRAALTPLQAAAQRLNFAALLVMHTNKRAQAAGRGRLADSSDLWDIARSVVMLGRSKTDDAVYVSHEKSSYVARSDTVLCTIEGVEVEGVHTSKIVFVGYSDKTDADFLAEKRPVAGLKDDVKDVLLNILSESNTASMPSDELRAAVMRETGCSEATYRRAKESLKSEKRIFVRCINQGGKENRWFIMLFNGANGGSE